MFKSINGIISRQLTLENSLDINVFEQRVSCRVQTANSRARKLNLPGVLTKEVWRSIFLDDFDSKCALTNKYGTNDHPIVLGHNIPISWGHGGTYVGNVYPIENSLNCIFNNSNPLTFIPWVADRLNINMDSYNYLNEYLAHLNGLSVQEYLQFVQWCHDYPPDSNYWAILAFQNNIPEKKIRKWINETDFQKLNRNMELDSLHLWKSGLFRG